jgi:hypothetical protein
MKKFSVFALALFVLILLPVWASAGTVEGSIQGLTCVTTGKLCPVGKEDPMAAIEKVFVVLTAGKNYYFVPNVDRAVLARHLNQRVRVTGKVSTKYPSISAMKIDVFEGGAWKTTWTWAMQAELEKAMMTPGL